MEFERQTASRNLPQPAKRTPRLARVPDTHGIGHAHAVRAGIPGGKNESIEQPLIRARSVLRAHRNVAEAAAGAADKFLHVAPKPLFVLIQNAQQNGRHRKGDMHRIDPATGGVLEVERRGAAPRGNPAVQAQIDDRLEIRAFLFVDGGRPGFQFRHARRDEGRGDFELIGTREYHARRLFAVTQRAVEEVDSRVCHNSSGDQQRLGRLAVFERVQHQVDPVLVHFSVPMAFRIDHHNGPLLAQL